jgi:hypothetical protein
MKTIKVKYYTDPGHGWIAVKRKLLEELRLLEKISSYSYTKGKTVYLEEDCDARKFLETAKQNGLSVEVLESKHTNSSHPIRSYERYLVPTLEHFQYKLG